MAQTIALCQALALSLLVHSSESMTSHPVWARRLESLPIKTNPSCGVAHCSRCSTKVVSGVFEEDDVEKSVSVAKLLLWVGPQYPSSVTFLPIPTPLPSIVETHARSFVPLAGETGYCSPSPPLPPLRVRATPFLPVPSLYLLRTVDHSNS